MPTSETKLTIYNGALDIVCARALTSTSEDSPEARWLNRNYTPYLETLLTNYLWYFAMEAKSLNSDGSYTAARGWSYRYAWPNNALRLVPPSQYGIRGYPPIKYELKGQYIYTNVAQPLLADFIMNETDPGNWHALFAMALKGSLAEGMAQRFVNKNTYVQEARKFKEDAIAQAEQVDAFMTGVEEPAVHDIILAREL